MKSSKDLLDDIKLIWNANLKYSLLHIMTLCYNYLSLKK